MFRFFVAILLLTVSGCASEEPRGSVTGKVSVNGVPLSEGTIYFENQTKGVALTGQIKSDGSFKLASHQGAGLIVGSYQVAISPEAMLMSADEIPLVGKNPRKPNDRISLPCLKSISKPLQVNSLLKSRKVLTLLLFLISKNRSNHRAIYFA